MSQSIQPTFVSNFTPSGILIEAISTTLALPNHRHLQVTVVYRSPSVSVTVLVSVMSGILSQIPSDIPSVILGDFNYDLLTKPDSPLTSLMSHHRYSQLVHAPTTDNGTLIDHVYYNRQCEHSKVQTVHTYFSDHDIVCCSLPI